jgi:hypothetical protein
VSRRTDENRLQAGYRKQSLRKDCTKNVQNGTEKRGKGGKGGEKTERNGKERKGTKRQGKAGKKEVKGSR